MNFRLLVALLALVPGGALAASRTSDARVGVSRLSMAGLHSPTMTVNVSNGATKTSGGNTSGGNTGGGDNGGNTGGGDNGGGDNGGNTGGGDNGGNNGGNTGGGSSGSCRDAYRQCMDEFCLLDESEGYRCACSANINKSKSLINEIQKIQEEADKLYTEGVEREQLGAKAAYIFGESERAKKSSRASGLSFSEWLKSGDTSGDGSLGSDDDIGDGLYSMASEYCAYTLDACGARAEMEEMLYSRQIVQDCKGFETYLADQKRNAEANKRTAEAAVRKARLEMFDTTNKYNRGECLLAYKACIADKGGCGTNFENCLDADLLGRRAHACENILDQCTANKSYVLQDWEAESEAILVDAAKYADKYKRQTCLAQIQNCLEEGCSTSTNSACLTDVNVAAGICPIIDECNAIIPGIKSVVNDKLGYLRLQFCQNDVDKCLQDKCGADYTAPECVGKKTSEIVAMCPQTMFPSCKGESQYNIIVQAALLQMDYQMLQGCLNHFSEQLGRTCGTDMSCLTLDPQITSLVELPDSEAGLMSLRETVRANSKTAVAQFFTQFEKDITVAACKDSQKPAGSRASLGSTVFNSAKLIAEIGAENRAMRELESKIAELSRKQDVEQARQNCLNTYQVEDPAEFEKKGKQNYSYIRSVSFEPDLRNCHVCRMQQVCETGGESKGTAGLKGLAGGLSAGAAAGTMVTPGWGTAIGGAVGAIGGLFAGRSGAGKETYCQEVESCEDVNM